MPLLEQVLEQYPDDVRLVFKNYPLPNHRGARPAAMAAMAAHAQGKFWEFHNRLFENYRQINDKQIESIAGELGLDMARFEKDRNSREVAEAVNRDIIEARGIGVRATPTIFVNGRAPRDRSPNGLKATIDEAIRKAKAGKP